MSAPPLNWSGVLRCAGRGLSIVIVLAALFVRPGESQAEALLSVLSYNVHGLSPLIAGDQPRRRVKVISSLASNYDVVLFQEDFEYQRIIRRRMKGSVRTRGNRMVFDPRRLAAKILLAPVGVVTSHFSAPYGAGLSTFVKARLALPGDVGRAPFRVCDGWLGGALDCWASKGYLRVRVRTPEGPIVDVYSTHLDAGRGKRSAKTRRRQLRILAEAIEKHSRKRAIIVGGDLNLDLEQPRDREVMTEFSERLNLRNSGAGPELPIWKNRDYILYRSGRQAQLEVEQAGEALEFVDGKDSLSDHPAIYARFRVRAIHQQALADTVECRAIAQTHHQPAALVH